MAVAGVTGVTGVADMAGIGGVGGIGSVGGIGGIGGDATRAAAAGAIDAGTATRGVDFASAIGKSLVEVDQLDRTAASKAVQAATGDLKDIHNYVIAAVQAQTATELTTTVRNKALDAFNEIMRMPL